MPKADLGKHKEETHALDPCSQCGTEIEKSAMDAHLVRRVALLMTLAGENCC